MLNCKFTCLAYDIFIDVFLKNFNTSFPLRLINSNKLNLIKPWILKGLMTSIRRCSVLYKQLLCDSIDKAVYTRYRNNLTNLIRIAKTQYFRDYFNKHRKNGEEIWKLINETFKKSSTNTFCSNVENLNSFFANLGPRTVKHFLLPNPFNYLVHIQRNDHSFMLKKRIGLKYYYLACY